MSRIRSPHHPYVVAGVLLGMGALTAVSLWGQAGSRTWWLDVAVAVAGLAGALAQLWWPVHGALAATVLATLSPVATPAATMGALQVAQRSSFPVAAAVAAAGMAAHLVQGWWRPNSGISLSWWLLLICAAYGALLGWGALARSRRALLISLRERAHRAETEQGRRVAEARMAERHRLAREMHDVLAHRLSLVATHAGALEYRPDSSPEQLARAAGVVRAGVHQALEELRQVIGLLREPDDEHDELEPWPGLAGLPGLIADARQAGQPVLLTDEVTDTAALPPAVSRTAYRVVQEGLTNARKHAPEQPVEVLLSGAPGTSLLIEVRNPLPPAGTAAIAPGGGLGLVGLTERVRLAGGHLDHHGDGREFRLWARLPWPA
ncbi:sensor histidine kinase [Nonomuraea gerenzanensis]|uniref:histidine kinase n=1 Tax=Nonomuraea gerenzanensis TaxID=93944 RepID=A0A1M4DW66_9ACTN|nr:histidine kinase [Nonomuraea gerenzanensis]UBU13157.1 histidine kinase [Nonomuraea gerenzanensis]SBO90803.1 two-component system sensor kinase [Nonomuraea gerenzanensis]